jgi:hypothetical protein
MKMICFFILTALTLCFCACKKESNKIIHPTPGNKTNQLSIIGKWNIVVDSTTVGVGINNYFKEYKGQAGDYFDFRTDGFVYSKEGAVLDKLNYNLVSDTSIVINSFILWDGSIPPKIHIRDFTDHSVTIYIPWLVSPGGAFGRELRLSR